MKKYFYSDGANNFGPFTIDELKGKGLNRETLVWFPEIVNWKPAGEVSELNEIFFSIQPPLTKETIEFTNIFIKNNANGASEIVSLARWNEMIKFYGEDKFTIISYLDENGNTIGDNSKLLIEKKRPPKSYLTESILVTLFCCSPFGIAGIVNAAKVESRFYASDIEGANRASSEAKRWTNIGFWIGLVVGILYLVLKVARSV